MSEETPKSVEESKPEAPARRVAREQRAVARDPLRECFPDMPTGFYEDLKAAIGETPFTAPSIQRLQNAVNHATNNLAAAIYRAAQQAGDDLDAAQGLYGVVIEGAPASFIQRMVASLYAEGIRDAAALKRSGALVALRRSCQNARVYTDSDGNSHISDALTLLALNKEA